MDLELLLFLVSVMIMWPRRPSAVSSEYDGPHQSSVPSEGIFILERNDTDLTVFSDFASYTQLGKSERNIIWYTCILTVLCHESKSQCNHNEDLFIRLNIPDVVLNRLLLLSWDRKAFCQNGGM